MITIDKQSSLSVKHKGKHTMIIDTQLHDDIFHLEREYEQAKAETDAVIGDMFKARLEALVGARVV